MTEPDPPAAGSPATDQAPGATGPADVLVARDPERAAGLLTLLREHGLDPVAAPVIERAPAEDPAELAAARERLADGAYAWVAITSVNAVDALLGPTTAGAVTAGSVRWAAVGPATRQALVTHGVAVDLVADDATGAGLAEAFPAAPSGRGAGDLPGPAGRGAAPRVLLPLGNLASGTLRAGLEAKGWAVDVVTAYRTVTRTLPPELRRRFDVVVVASGSAARQVAAQLGPQRVVAIGEPSASTARAVGHTVLAVAGRPTDAALADAVLRACQKLRNRTGRRTP
ncbi:uroporphyrinogen-III synthase [Promicromonospora umidemergens]|uniref:Uroporphyrinogen-III synthase n=1 Tax=Promicromonospora umidemergens TaxID=629679 RepID=A0ABP8Y362_9MICO|nr:uroporphyrinogen-III synthase [Promicromonospora umidemergens]MCP2284576.1 uroporphyrinogen-III synthase [Promicromonospora umidemergens]